MTIQFKILGSGTSTGVPVLGCRCSICSSSDPRNTRWRSSILVTTPSGVPIVVDTGPEFRLQALRAGIKTLENVFYTHLHADHCHGFDDLRGLFFNSQTPINIYLDESNALELRNRFHYAFEDTGYLGGRPDLRLINLPKNGMFQAAGMDVETIRLPHGNIETNAFRFGSFAYATDFKYFPEDKVNFWKGKIHTMVASGLRWKTHKTHSVIEETIELFRRLDVKRGIISHLSHEIDYENDSKKLPNGIELAFDGMSGSL